MTAFTVLHAFPSTVDDVDEMVAEILAEHRSRAVSEPNVALVHETDQEIARMVAGLKCAGVDLCDPRQRHAFLVGSLAGWRSAVGNVPDCCQSSHVAAALRFLTIPFGWTVARLARRA